MGPEEIRETLSAEGLSSEAIEYGLAKLATSTGIRSPLNFTRHLATNEYKPGTTKTMGCSACLGGWVKNSEIDPGLFDPDYPIYFLNQKTDTLFVIPCRNCRPHYFERGVA